MYRPAPSTEELEAIGLKPEDVEDTSVIEVWPENWIPYKIFDRLRTQWRTGMGGATGMDYQTLPMLFRFFGVKDKKQPDVFEALQVMEYEALNQMNSGDNK